MLRLLSKYKWFIGGVIAIVAVVAIVAGSLGSSSPPSKALVAKPLSVVAGPSGIVGGTSPDSSGRVWVLVNTNKTANVQSIDTSNGSVDGVIPLSNEASQVALGVGGEVAIGLSGAKTGAVEFFSATGFSSLGTVALPGPVSDLVAASDGTEFFALVNVNGASSVDLVSAKSLRVIGTIPMPAHTVSIALTPDASSIYSLQESGNLSVVNTQSGQKTQAFLVGDGARQLVISVDGSTLYVLKGAGSDANVSEIDLATESTVRVLPAPKDCQWIDPSLDGTELYDFVGNASYGNIQIFATHR